MTARPPEGEPDREALQTLVPGEFPEGQGCQALMSWPVDLHLVPRPGDTQAVHKEDPPEGSAAGNAEEPGAGGDGAGAEEEEGRAERVELAPGGDGSGTRPGA